MNEPTQDMHEKFVLTEGLKTGEFMLLSEEEVHLNANEILDRFIRMRNASARDLAFRPVKSKTEKLSALKQKVAQLGSQLADAKAAVAEKDQLIAILNRQLEQSLDECSRLDNRTQELAAQTKALENKVVQTATDYLDAAHEQADLETHVEDLEGKLEALQEARVQARKSCDEQMLRLFLDVLKLGESEKEKVQHAISDTKTFLDGTSSQFEKAKKAYETLNLVVHEYGAEIREFSLMAKNWITKEIDVAQKKMNIIKMYPKALEQIKDWRTECWPKAQCHISRLYRWREQMALQAGVASQAGLSAFVALRRGSDPLLIYTCIKTMYEAYAVMVEINTEACDAQMDLNADLSRTIDAIEVVLSANGKPNARVNVDFLQSDEPDESSAQGFMEYELPQDYSPAVSDEYEYEDYRTHFEEVIINPATGYMMIGGGYAGVDMMGNHYGFDNI